MLRPAGGQITSWGHTRRVYRPGRYRVIYTTRRSRGPLTKAIHQLISYHPPHPYRLRVWHEQEHISFFMYYLARPLLLNIVCGNTLSLLQITVLVKCLVHHYYIEFQHGIALTDLWVWPLLISNRVFNSSIKHTTNIYNTSP